MSQISRELFNTSDVSRDLFKMSEIPVISLATFYQRIPNRFNKRSNTLFEFVSVVNSTCILVYAKRLLNSGKHVVVTRRMHVCVTPMPSRRFVFMTPQVSGDQSDMPEGAIYSSTGK